ncbi:MAG: DUF2752 domain-containing protein, partial [Deltaproteobacteria bacterium]
MNKKTLLKGIVAAVVLISGIVILYFFKPGQSPIYPPCPFHLITGLYCPGCGSLRALHALFHGRFIE